MHWTTPYIGRPYAQANCAILGREVLAAEFGIDVPLPAWDGEARSGARLVGEHLPRYADEVAAPVDGDGVLMRQGARLWHVGLYCELATEPFVLHSMRRTGSVLTRIADLRRLGYTLDGFYRWRP